MPRAGRSRRRTGRRAIAFLVGIATWLEPAQAAAPAPPAAAPVGPLLRDPDRLISWVSEHSPDMAAAGARVAEAQADTGTAHLVPNPTLALVLGNVTVGTTNPPGLGFHETAMYAAGLAETIEVGKRGPRIRSARLSEGSAAESRLDTLEQKVADARLALGRVVHLATRQSVLEDSLEAAKRILDLERVRLEHGEISGNDYDRFSLDTMSLELDGARNRADLDEALSSCAAILRAPCATDEIRAEDLDSGASLPPLGEDDAPILARRPDIAAAELGRQAAVQDRLLAQRRALPDPNVSLAFTRDYMTIAGDQPRSLALTVTFPLPLFDHGQYDAAKATARAAELEATEEGARVRAGADLGALRHRKAYLEEALRRIDIEGVSKSSAILETTLKAMEQGEVGMTDLLLARRTHTALLLNRMDLRFELFSVRSEILRTLGLDAEAARSREAAPGGAK